MELTKMQLNAAAISKKLRDIFGDRIADTKIYDVVDVIDHHGFKIAFSAYNYFPVVFQCDMDVIGCHIDFGSGGVIPLTSGMNCLSDTDIDRYILRLKDELELRIPDKFLKAKGWL